VRVVYVRSHIGHFSGEGKWRLNRLSTERGLIVDALGVCTGNRSEAARQLGISRVTLHDKLKKHGIGNSDEGG
jgi:transcriptional regulator of acetoin/glycerol metabolism